MEEIIQFVVIVAIIVLGAVTQKKKKNEPTEEAFPPISPEEGEVVDIPYEPLTEPETIRRTAPVAPMYQRKKSTAPKPQPTQVNSPARQAEAPAKRINLRSPNKAREAFIYSEIFTRKYQ